jgi:hypothetical protein
MESRFSENDSRPLPPIPPRNTWPGAYFRIRQPAEGRPLRAGKLILVGRGDVGKTSLVRRLVKRSTAAKTRRKEFAFALGMLP